MNQSMKRGSQETITLWQDQAVAAPAIPLQENLKTEVAVIGAGISGLSVAYFLQKAGKSVAVIDAWGLGSGDTSRTSAHLTAVIDQRYYKTESLYGEKTARLVAESHMAAINRIETICREEKIDCDFVRLPGYLTAAGNGIQDLEKELPAVKRAGLSDAKLLNFIPELGENSAPALLFPQQAQFDIAKYLAGLAGCFIQKGGKIFTHSPVREISGGKKAYSKTESGYRIDADSIVVATHSPVNDLVTMHTKQAAYRSYIIVCDIDKNFLPPFLFWDTMDPYHYIRLVKNGGKDMVLIGGEDHKCGQADDQLARWQRLEAWARNLLPALGPVRYRWSGQIMESVDGLAFIGRNPSGADNVYIVTGTAGNGITYGTIAGFLISDLILGRDNPWAGIYDPSRKPFKALGTYVKENTNFMGCMVSDWMKGGEVRSADDIKPGEGAIMQQGASKIAVYRDASGALHEYSALCTHLKCIVRWNKEEKSWDCPCHGSRFTPQGQVLNGPALYPLPPATEKMAKKAG